MQYPSLSEPYIVVEITFGFPKPLQNAVPLTFSQCVHFLHTACEALGEAFSLRFRYAVYLLISGEPL